MTRKIFVNLPVKDLARSTAFYTGLGFAKNEQFSDDAASCMVVSDDIFVMLLVEPFFATFTSKPVADASAQTQAILALTAESRQEVDALVARALASGGSRANDLKDEGFMYGGSFHDPDGHLWETLYMDPAAA